MVKRRSEGRKVKRGTGVEGDAEEYEGEVTKRRRMREKTVKDRNRQQHCTENVSLEKMEAVTENKMK